MPDRPAVAYASDGSFEGLLCCVYESYTRKELPVDILLESDPSFFPVYTVPVDPAHARRVWRSVARVPGEAADWVRHAWLSCAPGREALIYRFIRLLYKHGARVTSMLTDPVVDGMFRLVRAVRNEAHFFIEFLRFSDYGGALVAEFEPKALVLPLIRGHFIGRFPEETMLIHDITHGMALFYRPHEAVLQPVDALELPPASETERMFRGLWRRYYDSVGIEGRYNPKCRMTHMPKHFWKHMTEFMEDGEDGRNEQKMVAAFLEKKPGEKP